MLHTPQFGPNLPTKPVPKTHTHSQQAKPTHMTAKELGARLTRKNRQPLPSNLVLELTPEANDMTDGISQFGQAGKVKTLIVPPGISERVYKIFISTFMPPTIIYQDPNNPVSTSEMKLSKDYKPTITYAPQQPTTEAEHGFQQTT